MSVATKTRSSDPAAAGGILRVGRRTLKISNIGKVLYPAAGFTKGQVIEYYAHIAPTLLPHLKDRPLTLKRYPNGVDAPSFYEKNCPAHRPDWVKTVRIVGTEETNFCTISEEAGLLWVANLASIELHTQLSRSRNPDKPTVMVFDLDPGPGVDLHDCARVALRFRHLLDELGLKSFPKTSGGKGLHLYVPLNTAVTFDQTKKASRTLAQLLEREDPQRITSNMRKDLRPGRVFIDWSQNDRHKTTVCVYSLRARPRPTVSTPITWDEVESAHRRGDADGLTFETRQVLERINNLGDLFAPVLKLKQRLPKPLE